MPRAWRVGQGGVRWLLPALLAIFGGWLATPQTAHAQSTIITVDADAPGPVYDGLSWTTAYTTVQDALDLTNANGGVNYEIWVAEGVYYPDEGGSHVDNEVSESFRIEWDNVQLYGGFGGYGISETLRTQRDWLAHPTLLSGDIDGDDANADGNFIAETWADIQGSNAYHVLFVDGSTNQNISSATVLDGFTLTAGQAIGGNSPDHFGGALYCIGRDSGDHVADTCSPTLANLTFSGNRAFYGGAMVNNARKGVSSPTLTNATFRGNQAITGGAMLIMAASGTSSPALTNVTFRSNQADFGGALVTYVYPAGAGSPTLTNALFSGNQAISNGGAMLNYSESGVCAPMLVNVTFSGNRATEGGAIHSDSVGGVTNPTLINTILWGNTAITSTQIHNAAATATLAYSLVEGDCPAGATCGAGMLASDPQFIAPIAASSAPTTTGDYRLQTGSPAIDAGHRLSVTVATALDGAARIQGCTVDMGAYEAGPLACLGAAKQVTPTANVPYRAVVTYTLILSNTGTLTDTAILTDALPAQVLFGGWLVNPGAVQANNALTWTGELAPSAVLTFAFTATHAGAANIAVTNTAYFSGVRQAGQTAAAFTTVKAATMLTLTSAPNPTFSGQIVTFTATVSVVAPGAGTPTGIVTFTTASGVLGTGNLAGGVATFSTASLPGGSHVVTATYDGDANFTGSHNTLTQTVRHQVQVAAAPATAGAVTGGGIYAHGVTAVVTATANAGYTFTAWTDAGGTLATTPVYSFAVTRSLALTATFTLLPQPLAFNDAAGVLEGEAVDVDVLANDHDPAGGGLTVIALSSPAHGAAAIDLPGQRIHYTAAVGFSGVVSVTYTVQDANRQQSTGLAVIVVTALAETDVAPQLAVVTATVQSTQHFTSRQATATAALPAHFFTGAITPTQVFFLSYTPVITPTAPVQTPPGTLAYANFEFELLAYLDDHPQHGAFALPITLTIRYDPAILGQIDPATLGLFLWDGGDWRAEGIANVSHDVANGVLTVTLSYLGDFALFGALIPTALDPAPEPGALPTQLYLPAVMHAAADGAAQAGNPP